VSHSDTIQPAADSAPAKSDAPKRSSIERILVRGLIGVLVVVLAIESSSYARLLIANARISSELKKSEASDHRVTEATVNSLLWGRKPDETHMVKVPVGEERFDVYYFDGLLKRRELWVHYGIEGLNSAREVVETSIITPEEVLSR
jgi:hypothetical protein